MRTFVRVVVILLASAAAGPGDGAFVRVSVFDADGAPAGGVEAALRRRGDASFDRAPLASATTDARGEAILVLPEGASSGSAEIGVVGVFSAPVAAAVDLAAPPPSVVLRLPPRGAVRVEAMNRDLTPFADGVADLVERHGGVRGVRAPFVGGAATFPVVEAGIRLRGRVESAGRRVAFAGLGPSPGSTALLVAHEAPEPARYRAVLIDPDERDVEGVVTVEAIAADGNSTGLFAPERGFGEYRFTTFHSEIRPPVRFRWRAPTMGGYVDAEVPPAGADGVRDFGALTLGGELLCAGRLVAEPSLEGPPTSVALDVDVVDDDDRLVGCRLTRRLSSGGRFRFLAPDVVTAGRYVRLTASNKSGERATVHVRRGDRDVTLTVRGTGAITLPEPPAGSTGPPRPGGVRPKPVEPLPPEAERWPRFAVWSGDGDVVRGVVGPGGTTPGVEGEEFRAEALREIGRLLPGVYDVSARRGPVDEPPERVVRGVLVTAATRTADPRVLALAASRSAGRTASLAVVDESGAPVPAARVVPATDLAWFRGRGGDGVATAEAPALPVDVTVSSLAGGFLPTDLRVDGDGRVVLRRAPALAVALADHALPEGMTLTAEWRPDETTVFGRRYGVETRWRPVEGAEGASAAGFGPGRYRWRARLRSAAVGNVIDSAVRFDGAFEVKDAGGATSIELRVPDDPLDRAFDEIELQRRR
ncbi:MAG TPA: hypothetical protein VEI02_07455 [Planctomycetota bacterium]|nr:hypothetical protein [Planctomycetota bacterium]